MNVTLVVPTLNEERYLPTALGDLEAAIQACSEHVFEVLVVDSDSEDATRRIAREHPIVDEVRTAGPGILTARHEGYVRASGDVVVSLDADTRYPPSFLEALLDPFVVEEDVVMSYGPAFGEKTFHLDAWIRLALQYGLRPFGVHWVS
ncbi:MAG: glycosyltransferase family 2 protein, partial [Halobacteriota archaeon]